MINHYHLLWILLFSFLTLGFIFVANKEDQLIDIAHNYRSYNQDVNSRIVVTDSARYKWTIGLCVYMGEDAMGFYRVYDHTFISKANDSLSPHGNKLYKLFVKDQQSYDYLSREQPIGQTLVKETWNVRKVDPDSAFLFVDAVKNKNDNHWYVPTTVSQLFIMFKETPDESNDKGWVYGIVDVEGNRAPKVLSQGNISSCIACHKGTKYDRLFGNN